MMRREGKGKKRRREQVEGEGGEDEDEKGKTMCNHTDTTRSYVSSNHDWALASLELVEDPVTLVLLLVSVDGCEYVLVKWEGFFSVKSLRRTKETRETYRALASRPGGGIW